MYEGQLGALTGVWGIAFLPRAGAFLRLFFGEEGTWGEGVSNVWRLLDATGGASVWEVFLLFLIDLLGWTSGEPWASLFLFPGADEIENCGSMYGTPPLGFGGAAPR